MRRRRKIALVLFGATALAVLAAEFALRWALFGDHDRFAALRRAERYADWFSDDDFWKLQVAFDGPYGPPENPHTELGWVGWFDRETYLHDDAAAVGDKRPVLLFGDSFAACVPSERCFEDILNADAAFASDHHLLNYGVAGYGVDQICLLMERAVELYDDPFVVLSLMTFDLDRSALSVRTGQKPRFRYSHGEVHLESTKIDPDPERFYAEHPPRIRSYLWAGLVHSAWTPEWFRDLARREWKNTSHKQRLNGAILHEAVAGLRARGIDFAVVVFHPHAPGVVTLDGPPDWREVFLREFLDERNIHYVWSKDLLPKPTAEVPFDAARWMLPEDGHPTSEFNALIAREIERLVLAD